MLFAVQTPQVFDAGLLKAALQSALTEHAALTDDCSAVERLGKEVYLTDGDEENIKITIARPCRHLIVADDPAPTGFRKRARRRKGMTSLRIGHGYDVHRLTEGRRLILGGVEVPYEKGLLGHSDADVLTHAVMDALLGAAALGDIGKLFPDTDAAYAGISSILLLERVAERLREAGYAVVNLDATVLAQAPKLAPYRERMRENLARALALDTSCVSVKATTEEGLGFYRRGRGIAAHAVALLEKIE